MMKNRRRWLGPGLVVAAIVALVFVAIARLQGPEEDVVRVGYLPITPAVALFVALEEGYFETEGVRVELRPYESGARLADDVVAGRLDAASPGPADVYLAHEVRTPGRFQIYMHSAYTPENHIYSLVVRTDSEITTLSDLQDKTIAVFPGVTNRLLLEVLLHREYGWVADQDFVVRGVAPPLQLDLVEQRQYDALVPLEPMGTLALTRQGLRIADTGVIERELLNPLYITAHAFATPFIERRPDLADAFARAIYRAVEAIRADPEMAWTVLPQYTSIPEDLAPRAPLGVYRTVEETDRLQFQALADLLLEHGALPSEVDVQSLYFERVP